VKKKAVTEKMPEVMVNEIEKQRNIWLKDKLQWHLP